MKRKKTVKTARRKPNRFTKVRGVVTPPIPTLSADAIYRAAAHHAVIHDKIEALLEEITVEIVRSDSAPYRLRQAITLLTWAKGKMNENRTVEKKQEADRRERGVPDSVADIPGFCASGLEAAVFGGWTPDNG